MALERGERPFARASLDATDVLVAWGFATASFLVMLWLF